MTARMMANVESTLLSEISIVSAAMASAATKKASIETMPSIVHTIHSEGKATCSATKPVSAIKCAIENRKRKRS